MEQQQLAWRKSSRSGDNGGNCVEVATDPAGVRVRDSKDKAGPMLGQFSREDWSAFLRSIR